MKTTTKLIFTKSVSKTNEYTIMETSDRYLNCELTVKGNNAEEVAHTIMLIMERELMDNGYDFQFSGCPVIEDGEYCDCISIAFESGYMTEYKEAVQEAYRIAKAELKENKEVKAETKEDSQKVQEVAEVQEVEEMEIEGNKEMVKDAKILLIEEIQKYKKVSNIEYFGMVVYADIEELQEILHNLQEEERSNNTIIEPVEEVEEITPVQQYYHIWNGTQDLKGAILQEGQQVRIDLINMNIEELEELKGVDYKEVTEGHTEQTTEGTRQVLYIEIIKVYPKHEASTTIFVNELYTVATGWQAVNEAMTLKEVYNIFNNDSSNMINLNGKDYNCKSFSLYYPLAQAEQNNIHNINLDTLKAEILEVFKKEIDHVEVEEIKEIMEEYNKEIEENCIIEKSGNSWEFRYDGSLYDTINSINFLGSKKEKSFSNVLKKYGLNWELETPSIITLYIQ